MYLQELRIDGVKRFRDFKLSFKQGEKDLKKITVLIGENGTGKTSILQAIALAATGSRRLNDIASSAWLESFADQRHRGMNTMIEASFRVSWDSRILSSWVEKRGEEGSLLGGADLGDMPAFVAKVDVLARERDKDAPGYFVAAYGTNRFLPTTIGERIPRGYSVDRLRSLFPAKSGFGAELISLRFIDHFADEKDKRLQFAKVLSQVMKELGIFDELKRIELRGSGGVRSSRDLANRFEIRVGSSTLKLTALALSHGFQSTLAWIADLIGHLILDGQPDPKEAKGIVLVDEIDLYLHPPRQVRLIRALKKTFPKLQFIVTTHSPLVLCGIDPEEDQVVRLLEDPETGDIVQNSEMVEDPRLLTGGELLQQYFGIDDVHPDADHKLLREYVYLAANPFRTKAEDQKLDRWEKTLQSNQIHFDAKRVPREIA